LKAEESNYWISCCCCCKWR